MPRPKGSPNKLTASGRALVQRFIEKRTPDELEELWQATKNIGPGLALRNLIALLEFAVPKLQRTTVSRDDDAAPIVIERRTHVFTDRSGATTSTTVDDETDSGSFSPRPGTSTRIPD